MPLAHVHIADGFRGACAWPPIFPIADGDASGSFGPLIIWSLVLIAVLLTTFVVTTLLRKRWLADKELPSSAAGFTLADLRELHRAGQMTDEEYQRAKDRLISSAGVKDAS